MLTIDSLRTTDLPGACRLSECAGWNQTPQDWRRLMNLWPNYCLAGRVTEGDAAVVQSSAVATATLALYPAWEAGRATAWVGMVLVDADHQRRGYGSDMLDEIIRRADRAGIPILGLDATDQGRPIYLKRGFEDRQIIRRWLGRSQDGAGASASIAITCESMPAIHRLDALAVGCDRSALIEHLIREPRVFSRQITSRSREIQGFGLVRPGRAAFHIGPIIAQEIDAAATLINDLLTDVDRLQPSSPVIIDAMAADDLDAVLRMRGFREVRTLTRMVRATGGGSRSRPAPGNAPVSNSAGNLVSFGFELG